MSVVTLLWSHRLAPGRSLVGIPAMALSRLVLGVHYPTDVAAGTLIGLAADRVTARVLGPWIAGDR